MTIAKYLLFENQVSKTPCFLKLPSVIYQKLDVYCMSPRQRDALPDGSPIKYEQNWKNVVMGPKPF